MLLFLGIPEYSWGSSFKLKSNVYTPNIEKLLIEITNDLPPSLKDSLNYEIKIFLKNLNPTILKGIDEKCAEHIILGRDSILNSQDKIDIEKVFINELQNENRKINCRHQTIKNYFKATVVHEVAHIYDQLNNASSKSLFLNISGWISKGILIHKRDNLNQNLLRTPDRYEFKSSKEAFAVNFEYFLYDPDYKCHRPTYYEYYSNLFAIKTFEDHICNSNKYIFIKTGINSKIQKLDFDRLYQIHYLFAGAGKEVTSRFGHAMIRLVFCSPTTPKGPLCLNDTTYHIVVSFRANIQDNSPSITKGLMGKYPSQLFLLSFTDILDEYTKGEFRELKSIPLKLDHEQLSRFLYRTLELSWSYSGKYYFLTNNCANEALNLLRIAIGEYKDIQNKTILSPLDLYHYLVQLGLADDSVFDNILDAEKNGYFFPSAIYKLFSSLKALNINESNFFAFQAMYSAEDRMGFYLTAINKSNNKIKLGAHALRLENSILQSENLNLNKLIISKFLINQNNNDLKDLFVIQKINELKNLYSELESKRIINFGYGIPLEMDLNFDTYVSEEFNIINNKINETNDDLKRIAVNYFENEISEIKATSKNRNKLLKILTPAMELNQITQ